MTKREVELILQTDIPDAYYEKALIYAKRKQKYIYKMENLC